MKRELERNSTDEAEILQCFRLNAEVENDCVVLGSPQIEVQRRVGRDATAATGWGMLSGPKPATPVHLFRGHNHRTSKSGRDESVVADNG